MAKPYGVRQVDLMDILIETHSLAGVLAMIENVLLVRWAERQEALPGGTTDLRKAELLKTQIAQVERLAHAMRKDHNRMCELPSPPTWNELLEQFGKVLSNQQDCAEYLEPDTQAESRGIYNRSLCLLNAAEGTCTQPLALWSGPESAEEYEEERREAIEAAGDAAIHRLHMDL